MTHEEMLTEHVSRFEEIIKAKNHQIRGQRLGHLMTDMEDTYEIPIYSPDAILVFRRENPEVMALYSAVSNARWN